MTAETISPVGDGPVEPVADSGGAGRGGSGNAGQGPLVVVQQGRGTTPPRPAPRPTRDAGDSTLRNGYAAISHSVSSETAAIGLGFLAAGPVGAIVGGATLPVLVAASMWRARRREHDENTNSSSADGSGSGRDRSGSGSGSGGNGGGRHRTPNGPGGGGRYKTPKGPRPGGGGSGGGKDRKPRVKDPVADKLSKLRKDLASKLKPNKNGNGADGTGPNGGGKDKPGRTKKNQGVGGSWTSSPDGLDPKKPKDKKDRDGRRRDRKDGGASSTTGRDGLDPRDPKSPNGGGDVPPKPGYDPDEYVDGEIVDDGLPPKPDQPPGDIIDAEVIDEDRIALVKKHRERRRRREALAAGRKAEQEAARDGNLGDPHKVKADRIRVENQRIDLELHHQAALLALAAATEQRRNTPVTYPVASIQPAGTRTAGVAVARQIDPRGSAAYQLLVAMAEQLANGLAHDEDADMADHVVELVGIPALCRNLAQAVREAATALQKTAPLHPSVIKHLNNASVAALTAARMADTIIVVFVSAHREDIYRVMEPRIGEERFNIRNAAGTLDAAKLRAAILSAGHRQLALPAGASGTVSSSGKVVPASHDSTKRLVNLMKGFDRGHMVVCLSEVAGSARGVEVVADAITKLYRRMARSWPTEDVVDDTVRATAARVRSIADELRKAIRAAQRAHERELRLNAKPRKGARAEKAWDVAKGRRG